MPNFDAGSYFLTVLAPIRQGAAPEPDGVPASFAQRLRMTLATLPTAQQTPATERAGLQSPFARSLRTHLCRFAVIDDVVYNGRVGRNPLLTSLFGPDPIMGEQSDRLNRAYLLFAADIDAVTQDGAPLPATLTKDEQDAVRDAYARDLWAKMEPELRAIFQNCEGFDPCADADAFTRYIARAQVETTMPFHDYWIAPPKLSTLPRSGVLGVALAPVAALLLATLGWLTGMETVPILALLGDWTPAEAWPWTLLASVAGLVGVYSFVNARGDRPFPPPQNAQLPAVLKALHLRERFADFAIGQQGAEPAALHAAFGAFLASERPGDLSGPTQPPGVVRASRLPASAPAPVPALTAKARVARKRKTEV